MHVVENALHTQPIMNDSKFLRIEDIFAYVHFAVLWLYILYINQEDKAVCDEWCCKDHGPDKCPRQYDCGRNAEKHGMEALKLRIDAIKQGKSRPGEGISEPLIEKYMPHTPPPKQTKPEKVSKRDL